MSEAPEQAPERPRGVPSEADWRVDLERWEAVGRDASGAKVGECRQWRPDGTLYQRSHYVAGLEDGAFTIFHPNGEIAREGAYRGGELDGQVIARVAARGDGEPLRGCCVPDPAREMRSRFEAGQLVYERFYDGQGRLLTSDGALCPPRPDGLPEDADYDEGSGRWMVSPTTPGELVRFFRQDGSLDEEARIEEGWKTMSRVFARDGSLKDEVCSDRAGRKHGPYRWRFIEGETSPYVDGRIVEERGAFTADRACGRWTFHDATGAVVRTVEHGAPVGVGAGLGELLGQDTRDAAAWHERAASLAADGLVGLALLAAARAAARTGQVDELIAFFARHTVARAEGAALELARAAAERANQIAQNQDGRDPRDELVSALVAGGDPAELLRELAGVERASTRAALDFVEAALLLAPDRPAAFLSRALCRLELGDDRGALADAARLAPVSAESAEFVRAYTRALYPAWDFWPAAETWGDAVEGMPDAPTQPIEAITRVMQVYATRLARLREAVLARAPHRDRAAWLPPLLKELLPDGPIELRRYDASITDETDAGPETIEVVVDETIDVGDAPIPALMTEARGHWAALTWLAWACGLGKVALPGALAAPADFPLAAVAALTRHFRVQDALATGGLRARSSGAGTFAWHGTDVDQLPQPLAQIALVETRELRALFLWLLSPENHSPFQSDLRE